MRGLAAEMENEVPEGAEAETSRAEDAWQCEEQHTIVCNAFEIGDKLKLTFRLVDLSSRVQLPTPWCQAHVQHVCRTTCTTEPIARSRWEDSDEWT